MKRDDDLVWSSDGGRQGSAGRDDPASTPAPVRGDGTVRISLQTKGRRGKVVTMIEGLGLPPADLDELARELKRRCGVGGTAKEGRITIQGDKRDVVAEELRGRGMVVKKAGG